MAKTAKLDTRHRSAKLSRDREEVLEIATGLVADKFCKLAGKMNTNNFNNFSRFLVRFLGNYKFY